MRAHIYEDMLEEAIIGGERGERADDIEPTPARRDAFRAAWRVSVQSETLDTMRCEWNEAICACRRANAAAHRAAAAAV